MKINETSRLGGVNPYRRNEAQVGGTDSRKKQKDEVHISSEAKELLGLQTTSATRIESLKQSVASGTYQVDAGKIAEKLLPYLS